MGEQRAVCCYMQWQACFCYETGKVVDIRIQEWFRASEQKKGFWPEAR
jgi:hypothetical protein